MERTTSAVKDRSRSIDITTIDTSIDGWKATKKLTYRGGLLTKNPWWPLNKRMPMRRRRRRK